MEDNNDRPWFSTPANPAPPVLNLSGISTVANKELEEGELSQTSNSHQLSHFSNLSRVESSKAVFRGQTEDSFERNGGAVEDTNFRSLSGWAGDGETSGASSKFFCKSPLGENIDSSKNLCPGGDLSFAFPASPQVAYKPSNSSALWPRQSSSSMSLGSPLGEVREAPIFLGSLEEGSRDPWQNRVTAPEGRSVTFNHEPIVFNIYDREESLELDLSGAAVSPSPFEATLPPSRIPHSQVELSSSGSFGNVPEEETMEDVLFKRPLAPPTRVFSASSSEAPPPAVDTVDVGGYKLSQEASQSKPNPATASKLAAFSERLRSLTSGTLTTTAKTPLKPNATHRSSLVTPRSNKTPESRQTTPRSTVPSTPLGTSNNPTDPDCYVCVVEGRGAAKGEVGIAAINLSNPQLILCQFSDSTTYPLTLTKLMSLNPCHVLYAASIQDPIMGASTGVKLYDDIGTKLSNANLTPVHRRYFNEAKGLLAVKQVMMKEVSSLELQFHNKYYCLAAANALLKYIECHLNHGFNRASLKIEYQAADQVTVIDPATAEHIELMSSLGPEKNKLSLFGIMNHCRTKGGVKLLRSNLFQPPVDQQLIERRQEAVTEMIDSPNLFDDIATLVGRFPNLEAVLTLCIKRVDTATNASRIDSKIDQMIDLRQVMQLLPMLVTALQESEQSQLLKKYGATLAKHTETASTLLDMLNLVLDDKARLNKNSYLAGTGRAMAVRSEVNGLLDMSRKTYVECNDQLQRYVHDLAQECDLPFTLNSSNQKGFSIHLVSTRFKKYSAKDLPECAQKVQKSRNIVSFVTTEFLVKDQLIKNAAREISSISNAVLDELLVEVREHLAFLYQLSEAISNLDLIVSLAKVSMSPGFVCPEFGDEIAVRQGRHPILDTMPLDIVANDIRADPFSRVHVLTGPNMSGKSTYLRQVILLCIMAQVGSRVPAESALLRIPDRIFSRVSNRDCIETNSSTFMVEMQETQFILSNVGPTSLVIIDELGRGTSVKEGAAICYAVCEHLLVNTNSFVFLATHFTLMTRLAENHPCASNHHFLPVPQEEGEVEGEQQQQLVFSHKLVAGKAPPSNLNYGLKLAASTLSDDLMKRARKFSEKVEQGGEVVFQDNQASRIDLASLRAIVQLKRLRRSGMPWPELGEAVAEVRRQLLLETAEDEDGDGAEVVRDDGSSVLRSGSEALSAVSGSVDGDEEGREAPTPSPKQGETGCRRKQW